MRGPAFFAVEQGDHHIALDGPDIRDLEFRCACLTSLSDREGRNRDGDNADQG